VVAVVEEGLPVVCRVRGNQRPLAEDWPGDGAADTLESRGSMPRSQTQSRPRTRPCRGAAAGGGRAARAHWPGRSMRPMRAHAHAPRAPRAPRDAHARRG
jgi:hypothetical protein